MQQRKHRPEAFRRSRLRPSGSDKVTPPGMRLSGTEDSQYQGGNRLLNLERLIDHEFLLIEEFT